MILERSSDHLPTNLVLIQDKKLIGHIKLSPIPTVKDCCFAESVVIEKELRGRGFGSFLMKEAEEYCKKNLQLKTIYLSTMEKEQFYKNLGYINCQPISIYGSYTTISTINNTTKQDVMDTGAPKPPPLLINNKIATNPKTYMMKNL